MSFIKGNLIQTLLHILVTTEDYIVKLIFISLKEVPLFVFPSMQMTFFKGNLICIHFSL